MNLDAARILLVLDPPSVRRPLRDALSAIGCQVLEAGTGGEALALHAKADLVVLDLDLAGGHQLLAALRQQSQLPIVTLSGVDSEAAKVAALEAGADDHVTKPFGLQEMLARLRATLRRVPVPDRPLFVHDGLTVDLDHRRVMLRGAEIKLSPKEYGILRQLVIHSGKVLTHRHLLKEVWGHGSERDVCYLRVYVRHLRRKLEADPTHPALIVTAPGVGYSLPA